MTMTYKEIFVELRNITTINLACKSTNWLERLLWYLIGLIGTLWAIYFITQQVCRKLCDLDQSGHLESGTKVNCNKKLAIASIMAELAFFNDFYHYYTYLSEGNFLGSESFCFDPRKY